VTTVLVQEVLPTLRSVRAEHWACAVASVLGVCLTAAIHPTRKEGHSYIHI